MNDQIRNFSLKKNQMEILKFKNAIFKMEKFTGWGEKLIEVAEVMFSELKKRSIEIIQSEEQREKQIPNNLTIIYFHFSPLGL